MPDMRAPQSGDDADEAIARSLRALPDSPPASDGWPRLAAELRASRRARGRRPSRRVGWSVGLALAATLVVALLWPRMVPDDASDMSAIAAVDPAEQTTAALIAQSQWLENLVSAPALAPDVQDSDQVLLEFGLRQRIRHIDAVLQATDLSAQPPLWQARVDALSQLAQVRWASRRENLADGVADGGAMHHAVMWSN